MKPTSAKQLLPYVLITAAVVLLVYGRVIFHDFVNFDDPFVLRDNPYFKPPKLEGLLHYWNPLTNAWGLYVPVTYSVWWLMSFAAYDPATQRLNAGWYHGASLFFHVLNAGLVFFLLNKILRQLTGASWPKLSMLGAVLWACHPVQVEAVCWTSGLKDVMAGTFVFASLLLFLRPGETALQTMGKEVGGEPQRLFCRWTILATVVGLLGILAKPSAMVAPVIALFLQVMIFRRTMVEPLAGVAGGWAERWKGVWSGMWRRIRPEFLRFLPWFLCAAVMALWARHVQYQAGIIYHYDWSIRPFIVTDTISWYVKIILYPVWLTLDHGRRPDVAMLDPWLWWSWTVPLGLGLVAWWVRKKCPLLGVGFLVSVLALGPVLGFVPFLFQYYTTVAEHYLYVSMFGVVLAVMGVILAVEGIKGAICRAGILGCIVCCIYLAFIQVGVWKDSRALFSHAVKAEPNSPIGNMNYGVLLSEKGEVAAAEGYFLRALSIRPTSALVMNNLIALRIYRGNMEGAIRMALIMIHRAKNDPVYPTEQTAHWAAVVGKVVKNRGDYPTAKRLLEFAVKNGAAKEAQADLDEVNQKLDAYNSAPRDAGAEAPVPAETKQDNLSPTTQPQGQ